jgi:hypothetical protein
MSQNKIEASSTVLPVKIQDFNMQLHESWIPSKWLKDYSIIKVHMAFVTSCNNLLLLAKDVEKRLPAEEFFPMARLIGSPERVIKKDLGADPGELIDTSRHNPPKILGAFSKGDELHVLMRMAVVKRNRRNFSYVSLRDDSVQLGGLEGIAMNFLRTSQAVAA